MRVNVCVCVCVRVRVDAEQDAANGVAAQDGSNLAAVGAGVVHEPIQALPFIEDGACEVRGHSSPFLCFVFPFSLALPGGSVREAV